LSGAAEAGTITETPILVHNRERALLETFMIRAVLLSSLCGAALFAATPAFADAATLLGVFVNWTAFSTGSGSSMTCYAMSKPRAMQPRNAKRQDVMLMVSDWPGRKIKNEVEILPGYEYKTTMPVSLGIGGDKFEFFARNDGKSGSAWLRHLADNDKLLSAMQAGVSAVAMGTPAKGAKTVDTYGLTGFSDAMAKVHAACQS